MSHPVIIISKCLSGVPCRWDGNVLNSALYNSLARELDLIPFCPEMELGLGCPRPIIRLIRKTFDSITPDNIELVQPKTGRFLTTEMDALCESFLLAHPADGFILKYKSPSCGLSNVKIYREMQSKEICGFDQGRFAAAIRRLFPGAPTIDDYRILQPEQKELWLKKVYAYRESRK